MHAETDLHIVSRVEMYMSAFDTASGGSLVSIADAG